MTKKRNLVSIDLVDFLEKKIKPICELQQAEEQKVLLSILRDESNFDLLEKPPGFFRDERNYKIYKAMQALRDADIPINVVSICSAMLHQRTFKDFPAAEYLSDLVDLISEN